MNKITFTTILGFTITIIFLLYKSNKSETLMLYKQSMFKTKIINIINNQIIKPMHHYEGSELNNCYFFNSNHTDSLTHYISTLNNPKLVLRFSDISCTPCINFAIKELYNEFKDREGSFDIFYYDRNFRKPISYKLKRGILLNHEEGFGLPIEKNNIPFFFVIDSTMKCKNLFIPNKALPALTKTYLKTIKKKLENNQLTTKKRKCNNKNCNIKHNY